MNLHRFGRSEASHAQFDALNLGCGRDHHADAWNVDVVAACDPDEVHDLDETPWPWPDGSFAEVRAYHVLEHVADIDTALAEIARVLEPGGRAITKWPMGVDAIADPDHERVWTWRTPEFYCGARHWDRDIGLDVAERDVEMWCTWRNPLLITLKKALWRLHREKYGLGPWCFAASQMSGEFTVVFEKP